jgi:hypothetical protein
MQTQSNSGKVLSDLLTPNAEAPDEPVHSRIAANTPSRPEQAGKGRYSRPPAMDLSARGFQNSVLSEKIFAPISFRRESGTFSSFS